MPNANIGIATGNVSKLTVLDVDPRNDGFEELREIEKKYGGFPETVKAATGGDGTHLYFRYVGEKTSKELRQGIDIKSDGGYVVAPPSIHPNGKLYKWADGRSPFDSPLAPFPDSIRPLVVTENKKASNQRSLPHGIPEGKRNDTLTKIAGRMRRAGLSDRAIFAALHVTNQAECASPLDANEVLRIAQSVARYEPGDSQFLKTVELPKTMSASALQDIEFQELAFILPGIVPEGLTILGGKPKAGKSFFCLELGVAVASGGVAFGSINVQAHDVLYLALEDSFRRLKRRLDTVMEDAEWRDNLHFVTEWPPLDTEGTKLLDQYLDANPKTRLVIVDTLVRGYSGADSSKDLFRADYRRLIPLQQLAAQRGVAIVLVHHLRKMAAEDPMDAISGTAGVTAAVDTCLVLERKSREFALHVKGRDVEERELIFERDEWRWVVRGDAETVLKTDMQKEIIGALEFSWPKALSPKEIADETELKAASVRTLLSRMLKRGEIDKPEPGKYTRRPVVPSRPLLSETSDGSDTAAELPVTPESVDLSSSNVDELQERQSHDESDQRE